MVRPKAPAPAVRIRGYVTTPIPQENKRRKAHLDVGFFAHPRAQPAEVGGKGFGQFVKGGSVNGCSVDILQAQGRVDGIGPENPKNRDGHESTPHEG